jgi:putative peptidoglycan lipid II flippase
MATALSAWTHAALLYLGLHQRGLYRLDARVALTAAKAVLASSILGVGLFFLLPDGQVWLDMQSLPRIGWTAVVMVLGIAVYALVLLLLGTRPRDFKHQSSVG